MIDVSKFGVEELIPYYGNNERIFSLRPGRLMNGRIVEQTKRTMAYSFYKASFREEKESYQRIYQRIVDVQVTLDGRISEIYQCYIAQFGGIVLIVEGSDEHEEIRHGFMGLSLRFWFPYFNFQRNIYLLTQNGLSWPFD